MVVIVAMAAMGEQQVAVIGVFANLPGSTFGFANKSGPGVRSGGTNGGGKEDGTLRRKVVGRFIAARVV